jgi:hypothetical protein
MVVDSMIEWRSKAMRVIKNNVYAIVYTLFLAVQIFVIFFFSGFDTYGSKLSVRIPVIIFFVVYVFCGLFFILLRKKETAMRNFFATIAVLAIWIMMVASFLFTNRYYQSLGICVYNFQKTNFYFDADENFCHESDAQVFLRYYTNGKTVYMNEFYFANQYNMLMLCDTYTADFHIDANYSFELTEQQADEYYNNDEYYSFYTAPIGKENDSYRITCYFGDQFQQIKEYNVYYTENNGGCENIFFVPRDFKLDR